VTERFPRAPIKMDVLLIVLLWNFITDKSLFPLESRFGDVTCKIHDCLVSPKNSRNSRAKALIRKVLWRRSAKDMTSSSKFSGAPRKTCD